MITLCVLPKAFKGEFELIQENALKSWLALRPRLQVVLFGDDEGVSKIARKYNIKHIPYVKKNKYGTPLLNDMFKKAYKITPGRIVAYVNADIILLSDFMKAIEAVQNNFDSFVMGGQRYNAQIKNKISFKNKKIELTLKRKYAHVGNREGVAGIDYFVFTRTAFGSVPEFAVGRTFWDKWLLYRALENNIPLIDATEVVTAIHQNHSYAHAKGNFGGVWEGPEARTNIALAGGFAHGATLSEATYKFLSLKPIRFSKQTRSLTLNLIGTFKSAIFGIPFLTPLIFRIRRIRHAVRRYLSRR